MRKRGSVAFSSIALEYRSTADGKSPAEKALLPSFLSSTADLAMARLGERRGGKVAGSRSGEIGGKAAVALGVEMKGPLYC